MFETKGINTSVETAEFEDSGANLFPRRGGPGAGTAGAVRSGEEVGLMDKLLTAPMWLYALPMQNAPMQNAPMQN